MSFFLLLHLSNVSKQTSILTLLIIFFWRPPLSVLGSVRFFVMQSDNQGFQHDP